MKQNSKAYINTNITSDKSKKEAHAQRKRTQRNTAKIK